MKRKLIKMVGTIFIVLTIFNIFTTQTNICLALSDVTANPDVWLNGEQDVGDDKLNDKMEPILTRIRTVGIIASVLTLSIIALRIMFGSVEEKSQYKQTLMPWVIGAFMVFSMTTIPSVIYQAVSDGNTGGSLEISSEGTIAQTYCINGYEKLIGQDKCTKGDECGCNGNFVITVKCPKCKRRLSDMEKYWYCGECGKLYKKNT